MEINPHLLEADALGNLYRSALFMVKGQTNLSISFLQKAQSVFKEKMPTSLIQLLTQKENLSKEDQFFWAEKILDQYHTLKGS